MVKRDRLALWDPFLLTFEFITCLFIRHILLNNEAYDACFVEKQLTKQCFIWDHCYVHVNFKHINVAFIFS